MAHWTVTTLRSHDYWFTYEERKFWVKDGVTIFCATGFHSVKFNVETINDQMPEFKIVSIPYSNLTGINMHDCANLKFLNLIERGNCWHPTWYFPESMSVEECDSFEDAWENGGDERISQLGWLESVIEHWLWWDVYITNENGQTDKIINTIEGKN